jgi:hypothetical protein
MRSQCELPPSFCDQRQVVGAMLHSKHLGNALGTAFLAFFISIFPVPYVSFFLFFFVSIFHSHSYPLHI